jgi:hypothetical protein
MGNRRLDFVVEEAGCLIWVAPRSLGGLTPGELAKVWMGEGGESVGDLVERGAMMPMDLYQDDGYLVRFILGGLTEQEDAEWVARARSRLEVPCGQVLVSGILTPEFDREFASIMPAEANGSYWAGAYVEVPPGSYRVEVYGYAPGDLSSGWGLITDPGLFGKHPGIKPEKPIAYFRRTRPNETPPAWINNEFEEGSYVDFIVRLAPSTGDLPGPDLEEGGMVKWEFRKPDICPQGIRSGFIEK